MNGFSLVEFVFECVHHTYVKFGWVNECDISVLKHLVSNAEDASSSIQRW